MPQKHDIPDLSTLLEYADPEELRAFLLTHARRNTTLAIRLRTHLVDSMDAPAGVNKFSQIIGLIVRHDVHGKIRPTKRSIQILREICQHFVELQQEYLKEGELRKAWEAGHAVISNLHALMDTYHGPDPKLVSILTESYLRTDDLLLLQPAPELRQHIRRGLFDLLQRSRHTLYDIRHNVVTSLVHVIDHAGDLEILMSVVNEKIAAAYAKTDPGLKLWYAMLLKLPGSDAEIRRSMDRAYLYDIAHLLYAAEDKDGLTRLLALGETPPMLSRVQQIQWAKWTLEAALHDGDSDKVAKAGWDLLILDQDIETYRKLKDQAAIPLQKEAIADARLGTPLRAAILAEEGLFDAVAILIRAEQSVPLLIAYLPDLLELQDAIVLILDVALAYAENNAGPKANEYVAELTRGLENAGRKDIAKALSQLLIDEFPDRFEDVLRLGKKRKRPVSKDSVESGNDDNSTLTHF